MKITDVKVEVLVWPLHEPEFWMSLSPVNRQHLLVVTITTDDGVSGIGFTDQMPGAFTIDRGGRARTGNGARIVTDSFAPILRGRDPRQTETLWQELFALTYARGWSGGGRSRQQYLACLAATDMALWEVKAKAVGQPVFRLLGGASNRVPCYMAGGYYRDGKTTLDLANECRFYARQGFKAIKFRVGGASLEEDAERLGAVRAAVGSEVRLMVDGNDAYDSATAVRAAKLFEPHDLFWLEEPVHWYEGIAGLERAAREISIPIAAGEGAATRWEAVDLARSGAVRFMQFDGMRTGGPTEWLKVAAACAALGLPMAPHHGPAIHAHLVAAVPNGLMVEVFADPKEYPDDILQWVRWDKQREVFAKYPALKDGYMWLSEDPGWGIELDPEVAGRRRAIET